MVTLHALKGLCHDEMGLGFLPPMNLAVELDVGGLALAFAVPPPQMLRYLQGILEGNETLSAVPRPGAGLAGRLNRHFVMGLVAGTFQPPHLANRALGNRKDAIKAGMPAKLLPQHMGGGHGHPYTLLVVADKKPHRRNGVCCGLAGRLVFLPPVVSRRVLPLHLPDFRQVFLCHFSPSSWNVPLELFVPNPKLVGAFREGAHFLSL